MEALFEALGDTSSFHSIEEANRVLAKRVREYNARPQAELGGLSPVVISQLLHGDWKSVGALRLNDGVSLDELADSAVLADARTILEYVRTEGVVKETTAHNLTRAAVATLRPQLRAPIVARHGRGPVPFPQLNEADVPWLTDLRYVLLFGKLLARRKGFSVSRLGRDFLSPERAGELYALLFRTYFRALDLSALDGTNRHRQLQPTLGYTFYKLLSATRQWTSPKALAEEAWLESAMDPPDWVDFAGGDLRYMTFQHRILEPLVQFGLLDARVLPSDEPWPLEIEYRGTPLFARFLRFEFERG